MLYYLGQEWAADVSGLNLFRYITFRNRCCTCNLGFYRLFVWSIFYQGFAVASGQRATYSF